MVAIFGEKFKMPQEKGPEVDLVVSGDEFYARYETEEGYSADYDRDLGLFTYVDIVDGKYVSTGIPVTEPPPSNLKPHLEESGEVRLAKAAQRFPKRSKKE